MSKKSAARDIIGGIFGGLIVIWTGISFYLVMIKMITWSEWGAYFCLGLAALFLLNGIAWLFVPGLRRSFIGMLIPALFLGVVGIVPILGGGWNAWTTWWPLIIVAVGLVIIVSTIWGIASRRRKEDEAVK
ncbi:hypothetical protein GX441_00110 [bacterium]|nr:hypothetical protein [bacterium]